MSDDNAKRKSGIENARAYFIEIGWEGAKAATDDEIVAALGRTKEAIEQLRELFGEER